MTEELKDITVENNGDMPQHVSRMVGEATELTYRIHSLDTALNNHEPGVDNGDGLVISPEQYDWMIAQLNAMISYHYILNKRIELEGYTLTVLNEPKQED